MAASQHGIFTALNNTSNGITKTEEKLEKKDQSGRDYITIEIKGDSDLTEVALDKLDLTKLLKAAQVLQQQLCEAKKNQNHVHHNHNNESHAHSHGGADTTDFQINRNAVNSFLAQTVGTTLDFTVLLDDLFQMIPYLSKAPTLFGYSTPAVVLAILLGLSIGAGSTYCHYALNKNSQKNNDEESDLELGLSEEEIKLSCLPKTAINFDRIGHMNEYTVPYTIMTEILTSSYCPRWVQFSLDLLCFYLGYDASKADQGTCQNAVKKYLAKQQKEKSQHQPKNKDDEEQSTGTEPNKVIHYGSVQGGPENSTASRCFPC